MSASSAQSGWCLQGRSTTATSGGQTPDLVRSNAAAMRSMTLCVNLDDLPPHCSWPKASFVAHRSASRSHPWCTIAGTPAKHGSEATVRLATPPPAAEDPSA